MARPQNHVQDPRTGGPQGHPLVSTFFARRTRRKRRLAIVAVTAAVLAASGWGVNRYRTAVADGALLTLRTEGLAAHATGDAATAVAKLDRFFATGKPDVEALLAFASAREKVDLPDGSHLRRAEETLLLAEQLEPHNAVVRQALLDLLPKTGDTNTLDRVADEALAANPSDAHGLRARMVARLRQNRPLEALDTALACAKADPLDLDAHLTVLRLMDRLARPAAAMTAYAESAFTPTDPRRFVLRAAAAVSSEPQHAINTLRPLIAEPPADRAVALQAVGLLDLLGRPDLSCRLLEKAAAGANDMELSRALARRLWQSDDYDRLAAAAGPLATRDAAVLAFHAAGLFRTAQFDAAQAVVADLATRRDRVAVAWAAALPARFVSPTPIPALRRAADACPDDAVLRCWLADALVEAGEPTLALSHYAAAADAAPAWPEPLYGRAAALVAIGETADAVTAAQTAYDRRPGIDGAVRLIVTRFAAYDRTNDPAAARDLLTAVAAVQAKRPGEPQTLAVRVRLLARQGQRDDAVAVLASLPAETRAAGPVALAAFDEAVADRPVATPPTTQSAADAKREIEHLREIAGDDGRQWRLARGRMLAGSGDNGDAFDAVNVLGELVFESPRWTAPRLALAFALERAGNAVGAAEHLRLAVSSDPNDPAALTELVQLLRRQKRFSDADDVLRRAGQTPAMPARLRVALDRLSPVTPGQTVVTTQE